MDYIMNYESVRIRPMKLNHVDCYAALCPKGNRYSIERRLNDELTADMKKDIIKNFIIVSNDFIVGIVTLEYLKDFYNGHEVYADARIKIRIPQERHRHLSNQVALAMINLCKATYLVDNLGIPAGKDTWTWVEIVPNTDFATVESKVKTA